MQAYASAEMATSAELRPLHPRPAITGSLIKAAPGGFAFDELVSQLADLVAARVIDVLARPDNTAADDWLDTRGASEYLGIHRDSLRRLAAERAIPAEQAGRRLQAVLPPIGSGRVATSRLGPGRRHPESA
jgi:excisionase family DNA binding protein